MRTGRISCENCCLTSVLVLLELSAIQAEVFAHTVIGCLTLDLWATAEGGESQPDLLDDAPATLTRVGNWTLRANSVR